MPEPGAIIDLSKHPDFDTSDPQIALRFISRRISASSPVELERVIRILQQAWAVTTYRYDHERQLPVPVATRVEWRDVPLVEE